MARQKLFKWIKNNIIYVLIRVIIFFFRVLPRRVALGVGSVLGRMISYVARKELRLAVEHLTMAFGREKGKKEILRLAHDTFRHITMNFVETVRLKMMSPEEVKDVCVPHNIDRLWSALKKGNGAIGLTSHTGCWELLGAYLAVSGVPVSVITRRLYDPRFEKMLLETRASSGINNISRGHDTREIINTLTCS